MQTILTNARLILENEIVTGTIAFDGSGITAVDQGLSSVPGAVDVGAHRARLGGRAECGGGGRHLHGDFLKTHADWIGPDPRENLLPQRMLSMPNMHCGPRRPSPLACQGEEETPM